MSEGHVATSQDIRNALIRWMELPADTTLTLSKLGDMMEDSFAKHRAVLAPYYQDMVECIEAQDAALITSQARLSEAVKVLEELVTAVSIYRLGVNDTVPKIAAGDHGDMATIKALTANNNILDESLSKARQFLATLGEET